MRHLVIAALLALPAAATAQPTPPAPLPYAAPDYRNDANWLCRPGRPDACAGDITATEVAASGKTRAIPVATPAKAPPIDCFYVYPTVSTQPTGNSDLTVTAAETNVARAQFAAMRSVCRTFAPMYRQVTLSALRDALTGKPSSADRIMAYRDVAAAWADYLARDNGGRGVVLVGHSQGSGVLKALLQNAIEGTPAAKQIIAAHIPGTNVLVPAGKDVGGDLKSTPICRAASQTGCVVAWVSFRDGAVPPADSRFGRTPTPGMAVACANPAALGGGRAVLDARLPATNAIVDTAGPAPEWATGVKVSTPFVALPGLLSGECRSVDGANVLAIRTDADPADPRTDRIGGDVVFAGQIVPGWGLHLIDVSAVMGDMVRLAEAQGKAWRAQQR